MSIINVLTKSRLINNQVKLLLLGFNTSMSKVKSPRTDYTVLAD